VIYEPLRSLLLRVLSAPTEPPDPPAGSPDSVEVFRASKRLLTVRLIGLTIAMSFVVLPMLPAFVIGLASEEPLAAVGSGLVLASLLGLSVFRWFLVRLDWDMRYYIVTDRSLRIRQGALIIRESTFTFANVQNVSVHQGPIDRLVGISNVRIDTAGGGGAAQGQHAGGHQGVLVGIDNAPVVRDRILALLRAYRDAGLGDSDDKGGSKTLSPKHTELLRQIRDELRGARSVLPAR
jgi:membrane protein YdbS with pleckstrin-like domain